MVSSVTPSVQINQLPHPIVPGAVSKNSNASSSPWKWSLVQLSFSPERCDGPRLGVHTDWLEDCGATASLRSLEP
jgi:hypothetical protein